MADSPVSQFRGNTALLRSAITHHLCTMSAHRPLCHKATKLVVDTLRTKGPMTTQSLYTTLHVDHPSSLPARPLPFRYLQGQSRRNDPPFSRSRTTEAASTTASDLPREPKDVDGTWSMKYLKNHVLNRMEQHGQVVKITKLRWDKLRGLSHTTTTATNAPDTSAVAEKAAKSGKKLQNYEKKSEESHLWVLGEEMDRLSHERQPKKQGILDQKSTSGQQEQTTL